MFWTDDPVRDADRYYSEQERKAAARPHCTECDSPIWEDETAYEMPENPGHYVCQGCIDQYVRDHYEVIVE